ncbi:MAG: FAD-dependent oxidoreductase [Paracoccaceae bacterium]
MSYDIVVSGAGLAGLSAACTFGARGWRVLLLDPAPRPPDPAQAGADLRSTAILRPGRDMLEGAGAWPLMDGDAAPLRVMRILETTQEPPAARDFRADEIGEDAFGWNLRNTDIRRGLLARLDQLDTVEARFGTAVTGWTGREAEALVRLSDDTRETARLVVAADGRDSPLRAMAGIGARTHDTGQAAIVFAVQHPVPHDDVSTEVYRGGGPFTLVPVPGDGGDRSIVVWMTHAQEAARLMALPDDAFAVEATERSARAQGPLTLVGPRQSWPLVFRIAERMTARRLALVAEAAHAIPPIGAQGLNMSLADIEGLAAIPPDSLGRPRPLADWEAARLSDVRTRMAAVFALNQVALWGPGPWSRLRAAGTALVQGPAPLRRGLMRAGLGGS